MPEVLCIVGSCSGTSCIILRVWYLLSWCCTASGTNHGREGKSEWVSMTVIYGLKDSFTKFSVWQAHACYSWTTFLLYTLNSSIFSSNFCWCWYIAKHHRDFSKRMFKPTTSFIKFLLLFREWLLPVFICL